MFGIRTIHDDRRQADRLAIAEVQGIMRKQFPGLSEEEVAGLPDILRDPLKYRFRSLLFVAEDPRGGVRGFAILRHAPDLNFCYLDLISAAPGKRGGGIGSALYQVIREEARSMGALGLFFECLPDDPALSPDPAVRKENEDRLAFYERFGARPIAGTAYETPLDPGGSDPPYLVLDPLEQPRPLGRDVARRIVRAILERKYGSICPPAYVDMVVESFHDNPVELRPYRYGRGPNRPRSARASQPAPQRILLAVNEKHEIHHVRERGYVESPVRIRNILQELLPTGLFQQVHPRQHGEAYITAVHDPAYVRYLRRAGELVGDGKSIYPYTFPIRNQAKPPKDLPLRAGYYCIDTFTPINRNAYLAARGAVNCTLTLASALLEGQPLAYALVRPPGHHAERRSFGGFCYFNSAAVAAEQLARRGKVAMLDVDYHHGNGQQDIFYARSDVLTISLHGPPRTTYPYFSGFRDERGSGSGKGFNLNLPLEEGASFAAYRHALDEALRRIARFQPRFLVLCLGLDTAKGDPTGSFTFQARDYQRLGATIGALRLRTLIVQEGGYNTRSLGINARHFFTGLHSAYFDKDTVERPAQETSRARRRTP
jgi:acetoin utilization deacetylase AcuC-like enzyme/GNAT superfamily N-acetyltransferase